MEEKRIDEDIEIYLASDEAVEVDNESPTNENHARESASKKKKTPQAVRVGEIPEFRERNKKRFKMSDGTEQEVFYASDVHVLNEATGQYDDIEDSISEDEDGKHFTNGKNNFIAKFSREDDTDEIFFVEQGAHKVTVCAGKNNRRNKKVAKPNLRKDVKKTVGLLDILTFSDVEADTDYEYSVERCGVKENIIIKQPATTYRFPFVLKCDNLTAQFDKNAKRVAFLSTDSGEEVFYIPSPFMTDANGELSNAVDYKVRKGDNGKLYLTVVADEEWLNSPTRAFPVAIDPQISVSGSDKLMTYQWKKSSMSVAPNTICIGKTLSDSTTYTYDYCNNNGSSSMNSATPLTLNSWQSGSIDCECEERWYKFVASSTSGNYTISTQGSLDTMGYLYDCYGNLIASNDDNCGNNFSITRSLNYGYTYYIKVMAYGTNIGSYSVMVSSSSTAFTANRMYMNLKMPTLPRNPRIKKVTLNVFQAECKFTGTIRPLLGLYEVNSNIYTGTCTPSNSSTLIDYAKMEVTGSTSPAYSFDITTLFDKVNKGEDSYHNLVLKLFDESLESENWVKLYGSNANSYIPNIVIEYESGYGVNTSYRTHTHELGRFGQGSVDLQCGNLMFESEDFAWSGNRMPVTIKHLFNSALAGYAYTGNGSIALHTADFSEMKIGNGFKLNIMQSIRPVSDSMEYIDDCDDCYSCYSKYVYIGENGEETYLDRKDGTNIYEDADSGLTYKSYSRTMTQGDDTYKFDTCGRLIKITDATEKNYIDITYTENRITSVTDGAGREFSFTYNSNGQLISIEAPDLTAVNYTYSDNLLTGVAYPEGKKAVIDYSSNKPSSVTVQNASGAQIYKVVYNFNGNRLTSVTEYGSDDSLGAQSTYSYSAASSRTLVTTTEQKDEGETANNVITTTYTFDDDGNIVSEYVYSADTGNVGSTGEASGINPHSGDGGAGVVSNINNLLKNHSFDTLDNWLDMPSNGNDLNKRIYHSASFSKFGQNVLSMSSKNTNCREIGIYQTINSLPKGQYTFSAYVRISYNFNEGEDVGAFIRVVDTCGNILGVSEHLSQRDIEYNRLIVPFELDTAQSVSVQILINGSGTAYIDGAQLENNPYANAYNMLKNGNFERGVQDWSYTSGVSYSTGARFNMSKSLYMSGAIGSVRHASQDVKVKTSSTTRETFTLSGWAKGYGLPDKERNGLQKPTFRLRAVLKYVSEKYADEEFTADFSPRTEEWQFASVQLSKSKCASLDKVTVYCEYDCNVGSVYFDDIQLIRNSIETGLGKDDFVNEDDYEEEAVTEETENETDIEETDTTDTDFKELTDAFGNILTETTFADGEFGTIYRSFGFTEDGNDLITETDARGNKTIYEVDKPTSRNKQVTDRLGNKTAYEYDKSGRTTKVTSKNADGVGIAYVSYAYDAFDNMTEIVRGDDMKYALKYNEFHNLESIGIDGYGFDLIRYTYKNGNGRLKEMTYANGDVMKATYNSIGQMVAEKWYNSTNSLTAHYKYVYDGAGNIVRSIDIKSKKEYNYEYEEGRIVRATEADITLSGEIVTEKTVVNTVKYYYDSEGKMTKKVITCSDNSTHTVHYENSDDNTVVKFDVPDTENANKKQTITSHSKTDSFGRKVFDELKLGTDFVSRQFVYHTGMVTAEHKENYKLTSSPTTQLVSEILLSDGRTLSYEYDNEERITSVTESYNTADNKTITNITEYTYDALGQLLTETVNGSIVNSMEYDNYGNIVSKNGKDYIYGDAKWKDLLTGFDGKTIEYDAQGNPIKYLGHTLTWEKGRQLKSFDGNTYTYNANGIRTAKIVNGIKHEYTLDGTKILRETWGDNTLIPLYDNEDSVCGIIYNGTSHYFLKNLQGDIIAIANAKGEVEARYTYDAWGAITNISGTDEGISIAVVNPFRYRGYYYDVEIELYYLQSRYYDPQIGRFVNADILITARVNIINLFAYCYNQPILYIDDMGYDAYMIFNTEYAKGMGHAALLVENYNSWYYFSVSDKKQDSSMIIDFCYLVKFKNSKTLSALNNDLRSAHSKSLIRYNYKYNGIIYFPGYFSKSFYYFYEYIFSKPKYNLLFNNCLQVASRALSKGTPTGPFANTYRKSIKSLQNIIIPNVAYNKLLAMNASIIAGTIIKVGYCLWRISVK